jgi:hypothetical protein
MKIVSLKEVFVSVFYPKDHPHRPLGRAIGLLSAFLWL